MAIASDRSYIWVVNRGSNSVTELNAATGNLVKAISGPSYQLKEPVAIAADDLHVWVVSLVGGSVTELNASTGALVGVIKGSRYDLSVPDAIASDGTHVWVAREPEAAYGCGAPGIPTVTEFSVSTGDLGRILSSSRYDLYFPNAIETNGDDVWVVNGDSVTEISASTGGQVRVMSDSRYGFARPDAIALQGKHVWVANGVAQSITEFPVGSG